MSTTKTVSGRAITLDMKIGEILREHPELLAVLVAQSPHFARLKNPILRRIHGGLVTVAQAAAVAGLDPVSLLRTLNEAIGQETPRDTPFTLPASAAGSPEPEWVRSAPVAVRLDVREDQRRHADPFARIMAAVEDVREGQVLLLRNTFEPFPLYDVLGRKGFVSWSRQLEPEDWEIYFFKDGVGKESASSRDGASSSGPSGGRSGEMDEGTPVASVTIDIKDLTPPQPMIKIMDALAGLKPGETLLVHHRRRPAYLYPKLAELGYTHKTIERGPDEVDIYIQKS